MPRRRVPKYALHKPSGQARVRINGKDHWLGVFGTPESHERYGELIEKWLQSPKTRRVEVTIGQLTAMYLRHCRSHYRKDGRETSEVSNVKIALRHLNSLFRAVSAADFTARMMKAVRDRMVAQGYVRTSINQHVGRVRRMYKWAVAEELVP